MREGRLLEGGRLFFHKGSRGGAIIRGGGGRLLEGGGDYGYPVITRLF
ncbi:MAG: hypothetical protein GY820_17720 [Gammaproteobacteria bacterium]|nr:hypothetical protein [Gammaproteobacteria bacterium]